MWNTSKWIVILGMVLAVSGCQTGARKSATADSAQTRPGESAQAADQGEAIRDDTQAVDLRIFLADTQPRQGWAEVTLKPSGVLYVNTSPVISRSDLVGIQAATDQSGGGVLVLTLSDEGQEKIRAATTANPGLHLALVVGHTMLAAPKYADPLQEKQLAFGVGSRRNAEIAAHAVAGVPMPDASNSEPAASTTNSTPAAAPGASQ
uniref:hypothetical protein n=1 Tax=Castellaniella defragrans TaxID=75697 RepID=UPI00333E57BE